MFAYAELDSLSSFSFLKGASHPEELVNRAAQLGYSALALADECSVSGIVRAYQAAKKQGLHLIVGSRFTIGHDELIIVASTKGGYENLCELITLARSRAPKGHYVFGLEDILDPSPGYAHLKNLPGCLFIYKPVYNTDPRRLQPTLDVLRKALTDRLWLGLVLPHYHADKHHQGALEELSRMTQVTLVAVGQVEMHNRSRQPLHDTLTAIRLKKPIDQCGYALRPNAEHHLRSRLRLTNTYPGSSLKQTLVIAQRCLFSLDEIRYNYPRPPLPPGMTPALFLRQETETGARKRYPKGINPTVRKQIDHELTIIRKLGYEAYFLTIYDIVRYARSQNILCQGRGSAANSAVCYCLGITEVDPQNSHSLFARFISSERNEPPDIDVDFEHHRREEVIQYIYRHYGRTKAALTAVVITYRLRSALRDVGKALGMDPTEIDRLKVSGRHVRTYQDLLDQMRVQSAGNDHSVLALWAELTMTLIGFPRHLSQHPGGFVIANEPLSRLVPLENAAMPQRSIVQWDKNDLDVMGLLKVDILALGMLGVLQCCLQLMRQYKAPDFSLQDIPDDDAATYKMIQKAETTGVFQIESRAQMSMLPRMKPATFYDLVIQVAIVRPGPIQGGMVHPYLQRRQNRHKVNYPKSELKRILERTLGVVIFQEQAMQVAMTAADFSAEEADQLRRSMAAWQRHGNIDMFRQRLIDGMLRKQYTLCFAESLYKQLEGFGSYGFPESHATSFAKLAWFSAWFKCHEPAMFLVALLNSQPMGFYSPGQLIQDARRNGVCVLPVHIQHSDAQSTLETNPNGARQVRLGFNRIKHLSNAAITRIIAARDDAKFTSIHDLASRATLVRRELEALGTVGALQSLGGTRRQVLWQIASKASHDLLKNAPIRDPKQPDLAPMPEGQEIVADYKVTGFTLGRHPLALLRPRLDACRFQTAQTLIDQYPNWRLARACGLVTMRQRPQTAHGTIFVTLEDETGSVNVIVHRDLARHQYTELTQARLLGVYGVWQSHQGVYHLQARRLVNLSPLLGQLKTRSRDFH